MGWHTNCVRSVDGVNKAKWIISRSHFFSPSLCLSQHAHMLYRITMPKYPTMFNTIFDIHVCMCVCTIIVLLTGGWLLFHMHNDGNDGKRRNGTERWCWRRWLVRFGLFKNIVHIQFGAPTLKLEEHTHITCICSDVWTPTVDGIRFSCRSWPSIDRRNAMYVDILTHYTHTESLARTNAGNANSVAALAFCFRVCDYPTHMRWISIICTRNPSVYSIYLSARCRCERNLVQHGRRSSWHERRRFLLLLAAVPIAFTLKYLRAA